MTHYFKTRSSLVLVLLFLTLFNDVSALSSSPSKIDKEMNNPPPLFVTHMNKEKMNRNRLRKEDEFTNRILAKSKLLRRRTSLSDDDAFGQDDDYDYTKLLRRRLSSSDDDAFGRDDDYDYTNTYFDLSKFSVKFHSCSSLSSFDFDKFQHEDDTKDDETFPYTTTQVVNYRLCPTDTCQDDTWKGCKNVYGNYVITLEDYFEAQEDYEQDLEEAFEARCEYCEECEYFYKKYNEQCEHYDTCSDYDAQSCKNYKNQSKNKNEVDYSKYLECKKVDIKEDKDSKSKKEEQDNDNYEEDEWVKSGRVYLKVYCDGSLKVGIFSDDQCSQYIGDQVSIKELTDLPIYEDDLKSEFKKQGCVSCNKNLYNDSNEEAIGMCTEMYDNSVKCNTKLPVDYNYLDKKDFEKWDETLSSSTCSTIEDIQKGYIDGSGFIHESSVNQTMSNGDSYTSVYDGDTVNGTADGTVSTDDGTVSTDDGNVGADDGTDETNPESTADSIDSSTDDDDDETNANDNDDGTSDLDDADDAISSTNSTSFANSYTSANYYNDSDDGTDETNPESTDDSIDSSTDDNNDETDANDNDDGTSDLDDADDAISSTNSTSFANSNTSANYYNDSSGSDSDEEGGESSNNGENYTNQYEGSVEYYQESSSSSSSSSIKDYQSDFTSTINDKYLPEGLYVTEDQILYIFAGILVFGAIALRLILSNPSANKEEGDYVRSDLVSRETGAMV